MWMNERTSGVPWELTEPRSGSLWRAWLNRIAWLSVIGLGGVFE